MPDNQSELVALNFVFPDTQAPLGKLESIDIVALKQQVKKSLAESGAVDWAVLGLDVSLNDATQKDQGVFCQPQLYGFVKTSDPEKLRGTILAAFPKSDFVSRPVRIRACDGSNAAASYAYKTNFVRRVSYRSEAGKYPCWQTRKVSLKAREHVELLLALDQWGHRRRLLLYGVKIFVNNHGANMRLIE